MNLLAEYARTRYTQNFGHWLRVRLLRRMASQPYTYFLQRNSGDLLKKIIGDVSELHQRSASPVAGHRRARAHCSASVGYAVFGPAGDRSFGGNRAGRILCGHFSTACAETPRGG